ncbi:MAG: hypothetical protein ACOYJC_05245 [Christensenellales bacterium]|jgi:hypothetical protein
MDRYIAAPHTKGMSGDENQKCLTEFTKPPISTWSAGGFGIDRII